MSGSTVRIRFATSNDLDALCHLYYEFHEFHVLGVPDHLASQGEREQQDWKRLRESLTRILSRADAAILVVEVAGGVVGLIEIYLREDDVTNSLIIPYRYGYVQSLIVTKAFRKNGFGKQLLDAGHQWFSEKGAKEIRLDIWEFEAGPLAFYQKVGYRTLKRTMSKEI